MIFKVLLMAMFLIITFFVVRIIIQFFTTDFDKPDHGE